MKVFEGRVAILSNSIGASDFDPNFEKAKASLVVFGYSAS